MGRLIISENSSLDGVVQDPTGEEGFAFGGWFNGMSDNDRQAWAQEGLEEALNAEAFLLGRYSDAYFAQRWLPRSGAWAERLNSMPKYVVSSTLEAGLWGNPVVLKGDLGSEITRLKQSLSGDLVLVGSTQLAHALWALDLVDELRLKVFPMVAGGGRRLFDTMPGKMAMRLVSVRPVGQSIVFSTYRRAREA